MLTSRTRQTVLYALQAVTFALFILALAATIRHVSRLASWQLTLEQGRAVLNDLSLLRTAAADAEASSLQYVMTGNESHLEPYDAAQLEIRDAMPRLRRHLAPLAFEPSAILKALEGDVSARINTATELHTLRHTRGYDAAQLFVLTGRSQTLDERIRASLDALHDAVLDLQDQDSRHLAALAQTSLRWLTASAVACLVIVLLLMWEARHPYRRRETAVLQHLAENSAALVRLTDVHGDTVYVNRSWLNLTGLSNIQMLDWGWLNSLHADDRTPAIAVYRDALTRRESRIGSYRVLVHDGAYVQILDTLSPIFDERGRFEGLACFATITTPAATPPA